jgi:hemerythrin-like metal-binding protein
MGKHLEWTACKTVGVPEFDADHAALLALARSLREALLAGESAAEAMPLLDEILELALAHFEHEEQELQRTAYPHLVEHTQSHNRLLRAMLHFKEDVRHARYQPALAVKFIHAWVVEHVRVEDSRYAEHLRMTKGRQAAGA